MKIITTLLCTLTILTSCSDKPNDGQTSQELWSNGQPKQMVIKTTDHDMYYELKLDSLGRIKELVPFSNDQMNGTQIYFQNNMEVAALINHEHGKREGFVYEFRPKLYPGFKGLASNGKFNGESTWYHNNGQPNNTGSRFDNKKEYQWSEYYESGKIKGQGTYKNNEKLEDWVYWNEDGTVKKLE